MSKYSIIAAGMFALASIPAYAAPATEPITEEPAGKVQWFSEKCVAYSVSGWGFVDSNIYDGLAKKTVFSEDGTKVWFRNPVSKFITDTWVEADRDGEKITLPMDQVIKLGKDKEGKDEIWTIAALKAERTYDAEWDRWVTNFVPSGLDAVTFTYKDGIMVEDQDSIKISLMCNGSEMVYGDMNIEMSAIDPDKDIVRFPEDAEIQDWTFSYGLSSRVGYHVDVAVIDNEVYMRGFWEGNPNATIKGTVEGDKLTFDSKQYVGYINRSGVDYFVYFMPCKLGTPSIMPNYQPLDEPMVFDVNHETGKIAQPYENPKDALKLMMKGGQFSNFELNKGVAFLVLDNPGMQVFPGSYGVPQAPTFGDFIFTGFDSFCRLEFTIQPFDLEGNALPIDNLRYSAWVDGERVLFDAEDLPSYEKLPEPTYEMPLDFDNRWGLTYDSDNIFLRWMHVPFADPVKVGAQVIFYDPLTNERKESLIGYYYTDTKEIAYESATSAVETVGETESVSVEYYDLMGARVSPDYTGICVKVVSYADGTVKSFKTVR